MRTRVFVCMDKRGYCALRIESMCMRVRLYVSQYLDEMAVLFRARTILPSYYRATEYSE